ncbi:MULTISPECIES: helix-turn-helix domain-containing protein [unclassified Frondihabitans]|uniref:helix-turn-helix domain-containing protein n=1 Tax=unclassified Frondihabitans TaxID=2626248 RepID=UPI0006FC9918|nr:MULTISPECIES: helix-turn-helix domain-containing protein [unclassified Frondihabitans]KQQ28014.1 hypothetical protein ASF54_04610 [Frondihabitans sp. Leaf304]MBF4577078.1 helix-turn-helix domain-containing protein [Frondihabitans sp. VKM Ac-2883]
MEPAQEPPMRRFYTSERVAEMLSLPLDDVLALVESGELRAVKLGVVPSWRIEESELNAYLDDRYEDARRTALFNGFDFGSIADVDPDPRR